MSRTYRKIRKIKRNDDGFSQIEITTGDDSKASYWNEGWGRNKKMKPYTKNPGSDLKCTTPHGFEYQRKRSYDYKENMRNVNRSKKKGVRQRWKKELRQELENLNNETKTNL